MKFGKVTPILRVFDEAKTLEFYINFLGFSVDWEHRFEKDLPLYMQVSKDDCVLHLSEHHGDCCPGAAMRIEVEEIDAFQKELQEKQYQNFQPVIQDMSWGSRDMSITDPFGNKLVFTNAIST
ncbi:MAG: VOC family protein [Oceanospirillaceae bacterium]|nr:VOC family protein [Oceanospirillaceae bacterium]